MKPNKNLNATNDGRAEAFSTCALDWALSAWWLALSPQRSSSISDPGTAYALAGWVFPLHALVMPTPPEGTPDREGRYQRHSQANDMLRILQVRMTVLPMFHAKGDDDVPK